MIQWNKDTKERKKKCPGERRRAVYLLPHRLLQFISDLEIFQLATIKEGTNIWMPAQKVTTVTLREREREREREANGSEILERERGID